MEAVDHLHMRLSVVCTTLARAHADLVDITADALRDDAWAEAGIRSPEHWLVVRAALSPARAREVVALARRRDELPDTIELLATGRLGIDQAVVVARHVPAEFGQSVAELAEHATVPQLSRCLSRYDFLDDTCAQPEADAPAHAVTDDSPGEPAATLPTASSKRPAAAWPPSLTAAAPASGGSTPTWTLTAASSPPVGAYPRT
jgi:hypothetical protein